jgi:TolB-like protein/DNA-binding winged helix-turn-helix (wHTH) protein
MSAASDTEVFVFAGFSLDPRQRLLFAPDGRPSPLSPRAFDTLLYLVEHPNQLVDKQALMKAVWPNVIVEENNLNQNISIVRRVLGETAGEHRFIVTVPGRGFRFVPPVTRRDAVSAARPSEQVPMAQGSPQLANGAESPASTIVANIVEVEPWPASAPPATGHKRPNSRVLWISGVAAGAIVLVAGLLLGRHLLSRSSGLVNSDAVVGSPSRGTSAPAAEPSVAVLPFANMSGDKEQEYFSDGLSEELLNQLAQVPQLRVIGRTSSFAFKGRNEDLRRIGEMLGVNHILEGSVRKNGKQLRISAQLINAADGITVWSRTYDHDLSDVFAVQEEIAKAVSDTLSVTLDVGEMSRANGGTTDVAAYDKYLQALALDNRSVTVESLLQAATLYREALSLDPSFARAWFRLYGALQNALLFGADPTATLREMTEAAAKLSALAPNSVLSNAIRMNLLLLQRKWSEADAAGRAMLAAAPTPEIADSYALFLEDVGRGKEALEYIRRDAQREPVSSRESSVLQMVLDQDGRPEEAQAEYQRNRGLAGGTSPVLDVVALFRLWSRKDADPATIKAQLGVALAKLGLKDLDGITPANWNNKPAAIAALRHAFEDPAHQDEVLSMIADHYGEKDMAFAALRRSLLEKGDVHINGLWYENESGLRADPRFKDILRDLGLVDYYRASGKWPDDCSPVGNDDFECH